jgi:hypothetical protein
MPGHIRLVKDLHGQDSGLVASRIALLASAAGGTRGISQGELP